MYSAVTHVALAAAGVVATLVHGRGDVWGSGGGGGSASVRLVSSASVPLPAPEISTQNKVATEDKALNYREAPPKPDPKPTPKTLDPKTIDLPAQNAKLSEPKKQPDKGKEEPPKQRQPLATTGKGEPIQEARLRRPANANPMGNEIPSGAGGPVQGPYGAIQSTMGSGGVSVGGDFGSKFGWYVDAIRQRVSNNWLQASIDPNIRVAPRVWVTFQIMRDGRVVNPELRNSSGISSLDRSALRAVYDSSPMQPLPAGYGGASVAVEFWFDLKR
jgi:TonB family protein